jgi:hypothetical protein
MTALRADMVFSYWVFVWYVLYLIGWIKYNPKLAFILGLIDNIIILTIMLYIGKTPINSILLFIATNIIIKVVPLYYLYKTQLKENDVYFTIDLFIFFCIWLYINGQTPLRNMRIIYNSLIYNQNKTPFIHFISQITTK